MSRLKFPYSRTIEERREARRERFVSSHLPKSPPNKNKMSKSYRPPKGIRIHRRREKAGLVRRHGKLVRLNQVFRGAQLAGEFAKKNGEKLERIKEATLTAEQRINTEINKALYQFVTVFPERPRSVVMEFISRYRPQLIRLLNSTGLPYTSDEKIISMDTKQRMERVLKMYSLHFTGNDIITQEQWMDQLRTGRFRLSGLDEY